jgi:NTE family protein
MEKKKVSLVLSSGGARGIAHIGIIEELEKRGYEICSIAGTSMGALIGGIYASGNIEIFKKWLYSLTKVEILKLFDFTLSKNGLVKGDKIFKEFRKFIPDRNIEELPIPFVAVSTDLMNNREIVFESGNLFQSIRASISIPTFFKPLISDDTVLVDGGLLNPTPVNREKRFDNDLLFVVNVEAQKNKTESEFKSLEKEGQPITKLNHILPIKLSDQPGYFEILNKTIGIMLNQISELTIEKYDPDMLITIDRELFGTYDFHRYLEIIEVGREIARIKLDEFEARSK